MINALRKSPEIASSGVSRALVPIGSIEQHSIHLPVGTDWLLADAMGRMIAERIDAYVVPALPFSTCAEHCQFKGSVALSQGTFAAVVKDIAVSLLNQGMPEIAFVSWHGGNWILKPAIRELNMTMPDMRAIWAVPYDTAHTELRKVFPYYDEDIHAGDFETSCIMHLFPELAGEERVDYVPPVGREFFDYVPFRDLSPHGVWGRPSMASADKGKRAMEIIADSTAKYLEESWVKISSMRSTSS